MIGNWIKETANFLSNTRKYEISLHFKTRSYDFY